MAISLNPNLSQVAVNMTKKTSVDVAPSTKTPVEEAVDGQGSLNLKVNDLKAGATSASGIDQEKVSRVANAIQNGRYTINPQRIAEKMIASEFELS